MGIIIESLDNTKSIAEQAIFMAEHYNNMRLEMNAIIDELNAIISGGGINEALTLLKEESDSLIQKAVQMENTIGEFLKVQVSAYSTTKEATEQGLTEVDSLLSEIGM